MNKDQNDVIKTINKPMLVMAPVGTGKTYSIVQRTINAIEKGIPAKKILCLSFTNKAAKEMLNRINKEINHYAKDLTISTFHAFCSKILKTDCKAIGLDADFIVYDEEDSKEILNRICKDIDIKIGEADYSRYLSMLYNIIQDIKIKEVFTGNVDYRIVFLEHLSNQYLKETNTNQEIDMHVIFDLYTKEINENHAIDFTDLVIKVNKLFNENPHILAKWQSKYLFIQVDEFQDTDMLEYRIISMLAKDHSNLAFFGDIDQTIYEWRGSQPYLILEEFKKDFGDIKRVTFTKNYRSTNKIIDACKNLISKYKESLTDKIISESNDDGDEIVIYEAKDVVNEAKWIAQTIKKVKEKYNLKYSDIAILTRTNFDCLDISPTLKKSNIPHVLAEHFKFFRRSEIKDAIAYLKFFINNNDIASMFRILKTPSKGIGDKTIKELLSVPKEFGFRLIDMLKPETFIFDDTFGLLQDSLNKKQAVIFDVETTGLSFYNDEIIEIAAIKTDKEGNVIDNFHKYICPAKEVGLSEKIHGYSDVFLLEKGENAFTVFKEFIDFINGCVLIGHNVQFDYRMLKTNISKYDGLYINASCFDTLDISRRFLNIKEYSLSYIIKFLNIPFQATHHAMDDVLATKSLLLYLMSRAEKNTFERIEIIKKHKLQFESLASQINEWAQLIYTVRPHFLLNKVIDDAGIKGFYSNKDDGKDRVNYINELIMLFTAYDDNEMTCLESLENIIRTTVLGNDVDRLLENEDRVPLITVHQAKGLEFDTVFIANATDENFPSRRSQHSNRIDEEHRLFYVAMTRAKKRLAICYPKIDTWGRTQIPSRFIKYIKGTN